MEKLVEQTLKEARIILYKMDAAVDKLEGEEVYKSILELQDLILEWNLLGHTFANMGVQDYTGVESK